MSQPAGTVSLRLRIAAGSLQETDAQRGLAHFMEHMAFNGSQERARGRIRQAAATQGVGLRRPHQRLHFDERNRLQARTAQERRRSHRHRADAVPRNRRPLELGPESDRAREGRGPLRTAHAQHARIPRLRSALAAVVRRPTTGRPHAHRYAETIKGATRELLADYYARFYRPERTLLVVTGDFDPAEIEAKIKAKFSDWQRRGCRDNRSRCRAGEGARPHRRLARRAEPVGRNHRHLVPTAGRRARHGSRARAEHQTQHRLRHHQPQA